MFLILVNGKFIDFEETPVSFQKSFMSFETLLCGTCFPVTNSDLKVWTLENLSKTIEPIFYIKYGESSWNNANVYSVISVSAVIQELVLNGITTIIPSSQQEDAAQYMSSQFFSSNTNLKSTLSSEWINFWINNNQPVKEIIDLFFSEKWNLVECSLKDFNKFPHGWQRENHDTNTFGIKIYVTLDESSIENGANEYLIDSHKSSQWPDIHRKHQMTGRPGTAFIFHSAMWERSIETLNFLSRNMISFLVVGRE